jgi:hypothetical protein
MSYQNPFSLGLDLGQVNDYTALAIIEKVKGPDKRTAHFHLRRLERYPLGTTYPKIADHVAEVVGAEPLTRYVTDDMLNKVKLPPRLTIDQTGVGAPVADLLKQRDLSFRGVVITGGERAVSSYGSSRVPKRDLVNALLVTMQNGHLKVSKDLELWPTLRSEMQSFKRKIALRTSHDSYEHWRESDHDDLVLAVCLACWGAARPRGFAGTFSYTTGERIA